jgi:hypothetical protein
MKPGRAARFDASAKTLGAHPEVNNQVLDAFYQNLYARLRLQRGSGVRVDLSNAVPGAGR